MTATHTWGSPGTVSPRAPHWAVLVHGGAGDVAEEEVERRIDGCRRAAERGAAMLRSGGSALDAAQAAVEVLEDDPLFNAGTGACLNEEGQIELDASIMEGGRLRAGGVCALPPFSHPIDVARAVLDDGRHVLYAGEGAARFAMAAGFSPATHAAMTTEGAARRFRQLASGRVSRDALGTVGAVARDTTGLVAAATSTGGVLGKRRGRVGDSPIPGAGNYADNDAGAASCTGHGEGILRVCLALTAVESMRTGAAAEEAARAAIDRLRAKVHTLGGIILVDRAGRLGLARSTRTMAWGALWTGAVSAAGGV